MNCEICQGLVDTAVTKTVKDGTLVEIYHSDIYCRSCRGLVNYHKAQKKLAMNEIVTMLENQLHWHHKEPLTTGKPNYFFRGYPA